MSTPETLPACEVSWCQEHSNGARTDVPLRDGWLNDNGEINRVHLHVGTYFDAALVEHFDNGQHGFDAVIIGERNTLEMSPAQAREAAKELAHLAALTA